MLLHNIEAAKYIGGERMEYQIVGKITSTDDSEMLDALLWLKDNFGTKIHSAQGIGDTKEISYGIVEATFNDNVDSIVALKAQFGVRLKWTFTMSQ